mmetsp:Transcript_10707/g.29091  ORF Transcript_10707/g.29091 Transcript_10707/m.29091 type:complete len:256 (+) Transcript_10707:491-1258(+)
MLTTARRSAAPMMPSPEGLSSSRKAVRSGSWSWYSWCRDSSHTATHSTHSTQPLQSRSSARANASRCSAGALLPGRSSMSCRPCTNSAKSSRPSSLASRAKKRSYQGIGSLLCMTSSSDVIWAQTMRSNCCNASSCAKRQKSPRSALPPSGSRSTGRSLEPRGEEPRAGRARREVETRAPGLSTSTQGWRKASSLVVRLVSSTTSSLQIRSWASLDRFPQASRVRSKSPAMILLMVASRGSSPVTRKGLPPTKRT